MTSALTVVHSDSHRQSILSQLNELRKGGLLCDVTLVVEDVHFRAHKALLAASSRYFSLMFTSEGHAGQATFALAGVGAQMFAAVLEFIYSASVSLEEGVTEKLLATAHLMEVGDLVKVLTGLASSAAGSMGAAAKADGGELPDGSKRKRGRPKKSVLVTEAEAGEADSAGDGVLPSDDADSPNQDERRQGRQSKRKIRPPTKYKGYKVDQGATADREPGKKGRKRKYPNTEARCDACDKVFKNHLFLKIHQRTHTGEKPFRCQVCGKSFTQKHTLMVHERTHTGEKPFVCSICSKTLCTKHSLKEHMELHKEEKSFDCDRCGKTFTQKRQLRSHYRVHTGKSLPECPQCQHKFMDTAQLKKHLRTHTGEKPFTCEICGKCFSAKSTLQTHISIHRGEKPYDCPVCNKTFADPSARRRHVVSHSGRKPFTCSSCNLSFTRLDNLKTHTKSHGKESAAPTSAQEEEEEVGGGILHLQQFQLPSGSEQEIQLVVTADVNDLAFVPAQGQEIGALAASGAAEDAHPGLALLAPPAGHVVHNVALVAQQVAHGPRGQALLEGQAEHVHVITLSKEALEQLRPLQLAPAAAAAQLQAGREAPRGQAIHVSSQGGQAISVSQTSEQMSGHHIQGQTFQIQAGTVSYLYTTGLPQEG